MRRVTTNSAKAGVTMAPGDGLAIKEATMKSMRLAVCAAALAMLAAMSMAAGEQAATAPAAASRPAEPDMYHPVFAHYMTCFGNSVEFYKSEIELAQRHGIEGFALNCGQWGNWDAKNNKMGTGNYLQWAEKIYEAAKQLNSGFKLFISPDGIGDPRQMVDMVTRFYDHPNQFRHHGKSVLSGWGGGVYGAAAEALRKEGKDVFLVPHVYSPRFKMAWSFETVLDLFRENPYLDGVFHFAVDDSIGGMIATNSMGCRAAHYLGRVDPNKGKIFMGSAAPTYNSANVRDMQGMAGYGALWEGLIRDGADWIELTTWSDYQEDSSLMPFRWPGGQDKQYFSHDESYLDVTAYYSAWYKSGVKPAIKQDKLYYAYRNRTSWQQQAYDFKDKKWVDNTNCTWPFDQFHDDVTDCIYVTTFLTAPAELKIKLGAAEKSFSLPAGIATVSVPMAPGVPQFTLTRSAGAPLIDVLGRKEIIAKENEYNSAKGLHLLNRLWCGGAAAGPVALKIEAENAKVHDGASIVTEGTVKGVQTEPNQFSGFTAEIKGLTTATYCVKITYSNADSNEARLTLSADGPTRAAKQYPHYIPAFLPPTGKGKFATISMLWSLYDTTTYLKLQWEKSTGSNVNKDHPLVDDQGRVIIDSIELVKVEPVVKPARPTSVFPELVAIPGGEFTMGDANGLPDEKPAHKVRLSPFAIGKYEVTNEEFEKFDPTHRKHRDGFSWRDREPVIYVSWQDGMNYCNWLSKQAGLTPVYEMTVPDPNKPNQKVLKENLAADGFRMPTEAEWEYVATGRGEGRKYPWGKEAPDATRCNATGDRELKATAAFRSQEAGGVMVAGSYPAGASRDGVMDLAGNVGEWCTDRLRPYTAEPATDPVNLDATSQYRVIRGGSWGYYGHSQRCADREYNSDAYPGYIYIGLRVVVSEAGYKKLMKK